MKFIVFTDAAGDKVAINVDYIKCVDHYNGKTAISLKGLTMSDIRTDRVSGDVASINLRIVEEDFHTVVSRLNAVADAIVENKGGVK